MNEQYFDDLKKLILIQVEMTEHPCEIDDNDEWLITILKQIYLDGCKTQAGADRIAMLEINEKVIAYFRQIAADKVDECEKAIREYHDYIDNADDAIAAIRSAGGE